MGLRVSEVRGRLGARYRRHGGGAASARTVPARLVKRGACSGWRSASQPSSYAGITAAVWRDGITAGIGSGQAIAALFSIQRVKCFVGATDHRGCFSANIQQLAESSDDEASRRKIPLESAIATSVSNRKPRLAEPRDGSVVRAQLFEPCERDCGSHDGISVLTRSAWRGGNAGA